MITYLTSNLRFSQVEYFARCCRAAETSAEAVSVSQCHCGAVQLHWTAEQFAASGFAQQFLERASTGQRRISTLLTVLIAILHILPTLSAEVSKGWCAESGCRNGVSVNSYGLLMLATPLASQPCNSTTLLLGNEGPAHLCGDTLRARHHACSTDDQASNHYMQELSCCQALTEMDAAHNQLSALPNQLCHLHGLRTLMLDSNR